MGQIGVCRYASTRCAGIESNESRGGGGRRPRNRDGHRPTGRCRSGHRTELESVRRRGRGDVLCGDGIGRAQGQLRGGRRVGERTSNGGGRHENRVQRPNALCGGRAAIGQVKLFFPRNQIAIIEPTKGRFTCPLRDTPDPQRVGVWRFSNDRIGYTGGKGILERQVPGQQISGEGEAPQTAQVLDPQRKCTGEPVPCEEQIGEVGELSEFGWYLPSKSVVREVQLGEVGEVCEFGRYLPSETVAMEVQYGEVGEVCEFGRYLPSETVAIEAQPREVGEVCEFGRYLPRETVLTEAYTQEFGEASIFGRYLPRETVLKDGQLGEFGQVFEFGWQTAVQRRRNAGEES